MGAVVGNDDGQILLIRRADSGIRRGFSRTPLYSLVFHCHPVGGTLRPHPLECLDAGRFDPDALPEPLASAHHWGVHAFAAIRGEDVDVISDPPRDQVRRTG